MTGTGANPTGQSLDGALGTLSDRGRRRARNEDAVAAAWLHDEGLLLAVADGVGGAPAGDVASATAIERLFEHVGRRASRGPTSSLRVAFERINARLWSLSSGSLEMQGMGTTLVAALVCNRRLWVANVGDSRAYLVRGQRIERITRDHSLVADQLRAGHVSEPEARVSSQRNVLTRYLGAQRSVRVDTFGPLGIGRGDRLVLCSDGLYTVVMDGEICGTVLSTPPAAAVRRLIGIANDRGGHDNISAIVYQAGQVKEDSRAP